MKKSIKRYLSYMLGIVLACGLGLTYAYAVGANDSNAFVTSSEWNAKVTQLETTLDSISDTIDDSNMDFVMSGPRLQSNLIEGMENCGGLVYTSTNNNSFGMGDIKSTSNSAYIWTNPYTLLDLKDGRQAYASLNYEKTNGEGIYVGFRYALKTENANKYVVISVMTATNGKEIFSVERVEVGDGSYNYSNAETLTVKLPASHWRRFNGASIAAAQYTTYGVDYTQYAIFTPDAYTSFIGRVTNNAGKCTISNDNTNVTYEFQFNSKFNVLLFDSTVYPPYPYDMTNRKMGAVCDHLRHRVNSYDFVAKVFSPMKNCYCLKNLADGEIPILNE